METTELNGAMNIDQWMEGEVTGDLSGFCKLCIVPGGGFSGDVSELPKSLWTVTVTGDVSQLPKSLADLPFLQ